MLKTKVNELAEKFNTKGFQESDGWRDCWKNRYNVSFKTVSGGRQLLHGTIEGSNSPHNFVQVQA